MTIQYTSDLHLEFSLNKKFLKANPLIPTGEILLLAGDIVPFRGINTEPTFWIYGNHHYNQPDFQIGNTILTSNQLGYIHSQEHRLFDFKKCIVLQDH